MKEKESRNNKRTLGNIVRGVLIIALVALIAYEGVMIYRDQKEYSVATNEYANLYEKYVESAEDDDTDEAQKGMSIWQDAYPKLNINHSALKEKNSDYRG